MDERVEELVGESCEAQDVPMDFDVISSELVVSLKVLGRNGEKLEVSYSHDCADSIDEVYDGFKGAMNTLAGFIDSRS